MSEPRSFLLVVTVMSAFFVLTHFPMYVLCRWVRDQRRQGRKACQWFFDWSRVKHFNTQMWLDSDPDEAIIDTACVWLLFLGIPFLVALCVCAIVWVGVL